MFRIVLVVASLAIFSCVKKEKSADEQEQLPTVVNDTIPEIRDVVNKKAVATYEEKFQDKDKLNNWKFAVEAFETKNTFQYVLDIQYIELRVSDTLTIPNFGIQPVIELRKGENDLSCIVGFQDKKKAFNKYKMVEVVDGKLKIRTLQQYRRGIYQKKKDTAK